MKAASSLPLFRQTEFPPRLRDRRLANEPDLRKGASFPEDSSDPGAFFAHFAKDLSTPSVNLESN
jgi:hypothetical protein